ncbi:transmembrane protein 119 [Spea bombifrons]|uniref:transmembrane protein 119 n=1 Tax=Spea bombifrons TaxID=233779 RepID=UPI00234A9C3C|nr:transmembrane protein 119 [Spea bombifrons]
MGFLGTLCILLVFTYPLCLARYTPSDSEFSVGSGDGDGTAIASPTHSYEPGFTTGSPGSYSNGTSTSFNILDSITQFLKEYMLLVIVVGSLAILMIFIVCAAVIMSHRHKASAYYPSSFSQKEYVNQNDKSGEAKAFHEIPEKAQDAKTEEVVDSSKQLQVDILSAAQNLKSPTKGASIKEDQKIQHEPKQTQEDVLVKENMEEAPICNPKEESPTEKMEETASEQVEEIPIVNHQDSAPIEGNQKTQEEVCESVVGANSTSCEGNPTYNNSAEGQESQQSSDTCTV